MHVKTRREREDSFFILHLSYGYSLSLPQTDTVNQLTASLYHVATTTTGHGHCSFTCSLRNPDAQLTRASCTVEFPSTDISQEHLTSITLKHDRLCTAVMIIDASKSTQTYFPSHGLS